MSYQVLARKYRPQRFADVVGQEHVTRTLLNALEQNRIAHAYLFVGPRGTGKTTIARIFAKCLNCMDGPKADFADDDPRCQEISEGRSLDVLEIDGASNRGIEEIRALRETVRYAPSLSRFKIYIIDEVHMLTKEAFNALLKTLEEPPGHVKFMFATTEPEKVLPTILSRCQRYDLRRIPVQLMVKHLAHIAKLETIDIEEDALYAIARGAEGCLRDAESTLDQLISYCGDHISESDVLTVFGLTARVQLQELAGVILRGDLAQAIRFLDELACQGKDLTRLLSDLLYHFRNVFLLQAMQGHADLLEVGDAEHQVLQEQARLVSAEILVRIMELLVEGEAKMRSATSKRIFLEVAFAKAIQAGQAVSLDDVIRQLAQLRAHAVGVAGPTDTAARSLPMADVITPSDPALGAHGTNVQVEPVPTANAGQAEPPAAVIAGRDLAVASDLAGIWARILERIGQASQFVRSYLMPAQPVALDDGVLTIGFSSESADNLDLVDNAKNRALIQHTLLELGFGERDIKFVKMGPASSTAGSSPKTPLAPKPSGTERSRRTGGEKKTGSKAGKPSSESTKPPTVKLSKEEFMNDPLIKEALDIFKGQIVDVRRQNK